MDVRSRRTDSPDSVLEEAVPGSLRHRQQSNPGHRRQVRTHGHVMAPRSRRRAGAKGRAERPAQSTPRVNAEPRSGPRASPRPRWLPGGRLWFRARSSFSCAAGGSHEMWWRTRSAAIVVQILHGQAPSAVALRFVHELARGANPCMNPGVSRWYRDTHAPGRPRLGGSTSPAPRTAAAESPGRPLAAVDQCRPHRSGPGVFSCVGRLRWRQPL
jgi:hypothetical protein